MSRHAARYAQGFAGAAAVLVAVMVINGSRQSRELDKALDQMHHRLELIQAETRGAMRARAELRRVPLAARIMLSREDRPK